MQGVFLQVLVDNLNSLIKTEIGSIMGVDDEIYNIYKTLKNIQHVLEGAGDKQLENESLRIWLSKLNDIAYEMDDVFDKCATQIFGLQLNRSKSNRYGLKKILNRHKIARQIKEVAEKLDGFAAEPPKFELRDNMVVYRKTTSILNERDDCIYGRDEEKEKILYILLSHERDSPQLSILPILGMGGLGKTTLAQLVYNHPAVTNHFDTKIWVCVSDNFDLMTLVKAMIESFTQSGHAFDDLMDLDALGRHLQRLLSGRRYLLILDDVWNEDQEKWDMLKNILACGSRGASIVVTTRLRKVADIMGTLPAHQLYGLSYDDCWLLFRQRAFGQEGMEEHYPNLEAIGKEIVKKCGGLPLAAKALGGLLRFKREENEWIHVKESEIWNLETPFLSSLRLSYQHLPLQLRPCFAYCAVFPGGCEIEKKELIYCWMAHGYISSDGKMDVEDVGNGVWNELVLRSLFQDVSINNKGKTTFKMHDLVHDLAQSIMGDKVEGWSGLNRKKIRQVNVRQHRVAFPTSFQEEVSNISYTLNNFKYLRMLDASWTDMEYLPSKIDKLKRLRYLNLSNSLQLRALPDTVCSLWNLKILNLNYCCQLVKLPKRMRYMKNLRHILLEGCSSLSEMPPKIGELTSLKTLSVFIVGLKLNDQLDQLQHLDLGGELEIKQLQRVKNHFDAQKAKISEKSNLRNLVLQWENDNASSQQQEIDEKVLEGLEPHPNLKSLLVWGFRGRYFLPWTRINSKVLEKILVKDCPNCLHLQPLGNLHRLRRLSLNNLAALEFITEDEVRDGNHVKAILFPALEYLTLDFLPNLKGLLKGGEIGESFPELQELSFSDCPMLILPPLSSLNELKARGCNSLNLNSFSKLSNLAKLVLDGANEHTFPKEGLQGLQSLKELDILNCDTLTRLPDEWLQNLTVERLHIHGCKELVELPEGMKFLDSLKHLTLEDLPKLASLPEVLQEIPSMHSLDLRNLKELVVLPEGMKFLHSLKHLTLEDVPKIAGQPEVLDHTPSLQSPDPTNLPQLTSLPNISIDPEMQVDIIVGYIKDVPSIVDMPEVLQHTPSLQSPDPTSLPQLTSLPNISIDPEMPVDIIVEKKGYKKDVPNLMDMPEVLDHTPALQSPDPTNLPQLTSLPNISTDLEMPVDIIVEKEGYIKDVPNIMDMPEVLHHIPSLQSLDPTNLPQLTSLPNISTDAEIPVDIIVEKEGYIKECILYCSLFPADYEFSRDTLIWSWLAAGLINMEQNGKRGAVAVWCFDELVRSNFIFHSGYDHLANQMKYRLGIEEDIFLNKESLDLRYRKGLDIDTNVDELEHLSLVFEEIGQIHFEIPKKCICVKTLLLHKCYGSKLENLLNDLFLNLKFLTTLDLSCTNIVELPSSIENLTTLQYLDMSKTPIRQLPESIASMGNLETLILIDCVSLYGLPNCMYMLINLQHLVLDIAGQLHSMPIGIGTLTKLQTLRTFLVGTKDGNGIGELRNMNKLNGSLCIMKLENVPNKEEAEKALLCDKKYLTRVDLIWSDLEEEKIILEEEILESLQPHFGIEELKIVSYSGGLLPSWISDPSFTQISSITLYGCRYCQKLPSLGELPSLKFLNIVEMDEVVNIDDLFCRKQANQEQRAFPQLEKLSFDGMSNLEKWSGVEDGDFCCLKELMIKYCPKLVDLPSLSYLVSLRHLEIIECPELFCLPEDGLPTSLKCLIVTDCTMLNERLCKEEGEDWIKVESVPTLYIDHQRIYSD